ncbi:MAG: BCSC C-terminal domain-containing protein [Proteobacteria bacterium]|nr:BCSC C-terminal domain-containing protein [Pseudomonadota bacterium]
MKPSNCPVRVPSPLALASLLIGAFAASPALVAAEQGLAVERRTNAVEIERQQAAPTTQRAARDALAGHATDFDQGTGRRPVLEPSPAAAHSAVDHRSVARRALAQPGSASRRDDRYGATLANLGRLDAEGVRALSAERLSAVGREVQARRDGGGALLLGWLALQRQAADAAASWFDRAAQWGRAGEAQEGKDQALLALARQAALDGEEVSALQLAREIAEPRRAEAMTTLGWMLLDAGRPAQAATFFSAVASVSALESAAEPALYGQILAWRASALADESRRLACDNARQSARIAMACGDSLAAAMVAAYESGRHAEVLEHAATLSSLGIARPDLEPLVAWSALRTGDARAAAGRFERLAAQSDDPGPVYGLIESLRGAGEDERLAALADRLPLVARILGAEQRDRAFARKQFDLAERLDPHHATAPGRIGWAVDATAELSRTSGDSGLDRLTMWTQRVGVEGMAGEVRLRIEAQGASLRAGRPGGNADLGWRHTAPDAYPPLEEDKTAQGRVSARWELPDLTLFGSLGSSPAGGAVSSSATGDFGLTYYRDPYSATAQVFQRVVGPSLLAYSGTRDPVLGQRWGGVLERGASVLGVWAPGGRLSAALGAEWAELDGHDVADNHRYQLSGSLAYDLKPEGFDYLRVGPLLQYSAYQRNLRYFTYGHGGYYSPQRSLQWGLLVDALSAENQRQQWRAVGTILHGSADEDAAPRFPARPADGGQYAETTTRGLAANLEVQWARLLAPHLIVGAYAAVSSAPGYDHAHAGVMLRVPFEPRSSLVSADLPFADPRTRR